MVKMSGEERLAAQKRMATEHLLSALHQLEVRPVEPGGGILGAIFGARPMRDKAMDDAAKKVRDALNLIAEPELEIDGFERNASGQPRQLRP